LLAEFDCVIEISNPSALLLIKSQKTIAGQALNPPFEIEVPSADVALSGIIHLIVEDTKLDFLDTDVVSLRLDFVSASIAGISGLDGEITIKVPVEVIPGTSPGKVGVGVNFVNAAVEFLLDPPSTAKVAASPISPDLFRAVIRLAIENFIKIQGSFAFQEFSVDPTQDGSLEELRFVRIETHCIGTRTGRGRHLVYLAFCFDRMLTTETMPERQIPHSMLARTYVLAYRRLHLANWYFVQRWLSS
jgi:hypothetical protein